MRNKIGYIVLFFLFFIIGGSYISGEKQSYLQYDSAEMESYFLAADLSSLPDHTEEIIYSYRNSIFDLPLLPRVTNNVNVRLVAGSAFIHLNKILLKETFVGQSSPKHPYHLQLLAGNAHCGAAKAYYVYALRHLII